MTSLRMGGGGDSVTGSVYSYWKEALRMLFLLFYIMFMPGKDRRRETDGTLNPLHELFGR